MDDFLGQEQCDEQWGPDVDEAMGIEIEHDGQPDDYTEWRDYSGGDYGTRKFRYWELLEDHDQYDSDY